MEGFEVAVNLPPGPCRYAFWRKHATLLRVSMTHITLLFGMFALTSSVFLLYFTYCAPPLIGGGISDDAV